MISEISKSNIEQIENISKKIRQNILMMIHNAKSGHPGGSLSCVEILAVLYKLCMTHYSDWDKNPNFKNRDRFVLSKGHASAALYATLAQCGYFDEKELMTFRQLGSRLQGHPCSGRLNGIEVSTGSLGQGLSIACGMAIGLKLDGINSRVYVLTGDGELEEGSVWEAAMNASHNGLNNLTVIIDRNRLQIDGSTEKVKSVGDIAKKFEAFGWETTEIDGHNIPEIYKALKNSAKSSKPFAIIANTIKGKGVSFMENNADWHGKAPDDKQLKQALEELK